MSKMKNTPKWMEKKNAPLLLADRRIIILISFFIIIVFIQEVIFCYSNSSWILV